ncbi:MAG: 3-oxo-tetronate kinase [Pseudomonadota bacterium]
MLLGCIGDDFTGSSDLANTLAKGGMRVTQYTGVPEGPAAPGVEAGVVALKSRSVPVAEAVKKSLAALDWLLGQGCTQIFFKYCSTFDSTPAGNIGPVAEALAERLGEDAVIVCPAFPATGRSIYQGHLFVADRLLSESGMEDHPLTPMTDADLRRWLAPQTSWRVGHVGTDTVFQGADAIAGALAAQAPAMVVVDAIRDADLIEIGRAAQTRKLITGGSGVALGLPANFRETGQSGESATDWRPEVGRAAILSGSCSTATQEQVARYAAGSPACEVTAEAVMEGSLTSESLAAWARDKAAPLIYSSADPATVRAAQDRFGREQVAGAIEALFADLARRLVADGVRRLISAGGETSGAVVEGLALTALEIGPEIAPGVPAVRAADRPLTLALKSGNFGGPDFFGDALSVLGHD